MIYWFKRKKDNYIFALEQEKQASKVFYQANFAMNYEYLGRSSGEEFKKELASGKKMSRSEITQKLAESIQSEGAVGVELEEGQKDVYKFAWELELEACMAGGDRTPPSDVRKKVSDPRLANMTF